MFCITIFETNFDPAVDHIDILNMSRIPLEGFFEQHLNFLAAKGHWSETLIVFEVRVPYKGIGGVGAMATHTNV